nr:DDE-type integrase/transposase/recombinase [Aliidiomarina maris]
MSDNLHKKVRFRTLNVIDDYNREVLGIDIATNMPSSRGIRYLDQLDEWHSYPEKILFDNSSEFNSEVFINWAKSHDIMIGYIKPICP